jgi:hypothetical protein
MHANVAEQRKIVDVIVGSRAYGTNNPDSDEDTVAVCLPTIEYFLGYRKFEQVVYKAIPGVQDDRTIYDLRKIVGLILDNNPNCMDILFTADRCIKYITPYWERIRELKSEFVSKKARFTFSGYGFAQLERIKLHRAFLLNPPKKEPDRKDYNLPETPIFPVTQLDGIVHLADDFFDPLTKQDMIEDLKAIYSDQVLILIKKNLKEEYREIALDLFRKGLDSQLYAIKSIGNEYIKPEYKEMAINELSYAAALKGWKRYLAWKAGRNKKRAETEEKYGYDTKHAMHLTRLMRMGTEILETGIVNVDRTGIDADELKNIRNGGWSFDKVEQYAHDMDSKMTSLYKTSSLRHVPNHELVSEKLIEIIKDYLRERNEL